MSSLLVKNALAIVTVDDEDRILKNENILIEDGVITYIGKEARQADKEIRADGCFVYPGLVNTHNHLYQTFTRNLPQVQKMELFPWLVTLYEIWKGLDEDCIFYSWVSCCETAARPPWTTTMSSRGSGQSILSIGSSRQRICWASVFTPPEAACLWENRTAACLRMSLSSRWMSF